MPTIQAVVRALSRATGQQFLVDPRVKGNLTLVSEGQVPAHQAYDMLLAALRMQGFSVVDVGGVAQVVPEADAKLLGGPIYSAGSSGMQTRTFRLQYENAVNLIPVLRPIVSPNNPINAYPGNNSIVITDYAENLARVAQIIDGIDTPSAIDTDVVMVQNGIAVDWLGSNDFRRPDNEARPCLSPAPRLQHAAFDLLSPPLLSFAAPVPVLLPAEPLVFSEAAAFL